MNTRITAATFAMALTAMAASAALDGPIFLQSDFAADFQHGLSWPSLGCGAKPTGEMAEYFQRYSAESSYEILKIQEKYYALSPTEFEGGKEADEWIITPPIEITEDNVMLEYEPAIYGNRSKNDYKVLLSTTGSAREDFTVTVATDQVKGSGNVGYSTERVALLEGYKGKTIRLAFVNVKNMSGMVGLHNLTVGSYYISVNDLELLDVVLLNKDYPQFGIAVNMATPERSEGFTATLRTKDGYESTYTSTKIFNDKKVVVETFLFPGTIDMKGKTGTEYTVTIKPNYEGATETVLSGRFIMPEMSWMRPLFAEELTGLWCGNCTWGVGMLNYLNDRYKGSETEGAFYGIAVHNDDRMAQAELSANVSAFGKPLGLEGIPAMLLNRGTVVHPRIALNPSHQIMNSKSCLKTEIERVDYDEATGNVTVHFLNTHSYDAGKMTYRVLAYVTEDNLSDPNWAQKNYMHTLTRADIDSEFAPEVAEYFYDFLEDPDSYKYGIVYNDVARGVYPSFKGMEFTAEYSGYKGEGGNFSFTMPTQVKDVKNTAITLALVDNRSLCVVAADRKTFANYNEGNVTPGALTETSMESFKVCAVANGILVDSPADCRINVYSTSGASLKSAEVKAGKTLLNLGGYNGVAIVSVSDGNAMTTRKVVLK